VVLAQLGLIDFQGALVERLGLRELAHALVQQRQAVEGGGDVGVVLAQLGLRDFQGAPVERLRLRVLAHAPVQRGQVVEGGGDGGVVLAQLGLIDFQGALVERLRLGVLAHVVVQQRQVMQQVCGVRVVLAVDFLRLCKRRPVRPLGLGQFSLPFERPGLVPKRFDLVPLLLRLSRSRAHRRQCDHEAQPPAARAPQLRHGPPPACFDVEGERAHCALDG
jgi:hypothetical protein